MLLKAYHISHRKNRDSILSNGLLPKSKDSGIIQYPPSIFLSLSTQDLGYDFVDYENVDCWEFEIDSEKIKPDLFSGSTNHFYTTEKISPEKLSLNELFSV